MSWSAKLAASLARLRADAVKQRVVQSLTLGLDLWLQAISRSLGGDC
jgi:hypothetical protein